jgi:small-conductance mechanosensitive channel
MNIGRYLIPALTCILVLAYCLNRHMGFILVFVIPIVLVWALTRIYSAWKSPESRRGETVRVGMWVFTLSAVICTHIYYANTARGVADRVADAVVAYKLANGVYPQSIQVVEAELQAEAKYWRLHYSAKAQEPILIYPATWVIYERWSFSFGEGKWEYLPD